LATRPDLTRCIRCAAPLCALLALALPGVPRADAIVACRSDPVILVNGATFDVYDTLQTDAASVRELDYTVTVPAGSLLGGIQLTVGLGFPEQVTLVYSPAQPWGSITVAGRVLAQPGVAPFPVALTVATLPLKSGAASGSSSDTLSVTLHNSLMLL
jgi:hypothetical protein